MYLIIDLIVDLLDATPCEVLGICERYGVDPSSSVASCEVQPYAVIADDDGQWFFDWEGRGHFHGPLASSGMVVRLADDEPMGAKRQRAETTPTSPGPGECPRRQRRVAEGEAGGRRSGAEATGPGGP